MVIDAYHEAQEAVDHMKKKVDILRDTQTMITKEIWRKKQLIKIASTNKTFHTSFKKSRVPRSRSKHENQPNIIRYASYTRDDCPDTKFMYSSETPSNPNSSFTSSNRGVSFPPGFFKNTIQEEVIELEKLQQDVDDIEEKIYYEKECLQYYTSHYTQIQNQYLDKRSSLEDLMEFRN